ncbi:MAG: hypothetical protein DHS20C09_04710 [marine bacterium B5-7]|nr:MAG: hypothetical protein DHS20C09_04710 [marine bacterium B5-7]
MSKECSKGALLIFTKAPVRGKVKTRLIPGIGRRRATLLYQDLLTKTLSTARKAGFSSIQVWVDGDMEHRYFSRLKNRHLVKLHKQKGKDLGERMSNAFDTALRQYSHAVLIGSDCPALKYSDLVSSAEYLKNNTDVVLGPAVDGGYYLIGLIKNNAQIFSNIKWGKDQVFTDTRKNINTLGWKLDLLSKRWDVDRTADLLPYFKIKRTNSVLYY